MAGLACGEVSELAWEVLHPGTDVAVALDDAWALQAMKTLAARADRDPPIVASETGAVGLAVLLAAGATPACAARWRSTARRGCCCSAARATRSGDLPPGRRRSAAEVLR